MKRKTIAVNARFLLKNRLEGIGTFTAETLKRITPQHPEYEFAFLFDRPYDESFIFSDNVTPYVVPPPARHPFLWYAWFELAVPRMLRRIGASAFLSPDGFCSLRTDVPTAMVMHDLAFEHYPEQVPFWARHYYRRYSPLYAQKAASIAVVSEYTKQDIVRHYGISAKKIKVVYNGIRDDFSPPTPEQIAAAKARYAQNCDYFLFLSAVHPRKNLENILRAFDVFKGKTTGDTKLLVAGRMAWKSGGIAGIYESLAHQSDVIFLGHLQPYELNGILGGAIALVYASLFEGFGIPILEAFATKTAVITSKVSSMPEVAGDAALLVDPTQVQAIAQAMQTLYEQPQLRQSLIEKAYDRRLHFGWRQTAEKLWACVEEVL